MTDKKPIIFDLDGTLYVSIDITREIRLSVSRYIGSLLGIEDGRAWFMIQDARKKISAQSGREATLTSACMELGGDLKDLHRHFAIEIKPSLYLDKNQELLNILERLSGKFELFIYTNNNRYLCSEIMKALGISACFSGVFTIEDFWRPKPDLSALEQIFARIGRRPQECLFIGDRYDVDLHLPELMGSRVILVRNVQELLIHLEKLTEEDLVQLA